ncbi:LysE family transporter [Streptomyces sp. NBC_00048]
MLGATGVLALLTLVPGPDMAVVTKRAVTRGRADGLRTVGGIAVGLLLWGALTVAGLAARLAASAEVYLAVKLAGAAYLCWLGTYVYVLSRARRFFARPRVRRALDRVTGVVLIGFGVRVATTS